MRINSSILHLGCTTMTRICSTYSGITVQLRVEYPLNKISSTRTLSGIPYQVYFMSCNLDHVLYDKLNSTDEEKEKDALCFAKKYRSNIPEFVTFISNSSFTVKGSYLDSWAFIKEEKRSLERFTNLRVCIERAQESLASEKIQKSSEG